MQLAIVRGKEGVFAKTFFMEIREEMPAYQWWQVSSCDSQWPAEFLKWHPLKYRRLAFV